MKWISMLLAAVVLTFGGSGTWAVEGLDPSEATPGRTGVCITEMDGGTRLEIPLTVLGTIGSGTPDGEIILVRLDHPRMQETGIIAGMSGSPVYLDGKLLGALAFGWPFATEPIGGVTPFSRMIEVESGPSATAVNVRPELEEILAAAGEETLGELVVDWILPADSGEQRPLPLAVSGWNPPPSGSWLAEGWRRLGWVAATGGGEGRSEGSGEVEPGSMVAAVMVDGDVTLSAGGTVTEVRGDRLWAFGHPSLGTGTSNMPLARAQVVAVLPNLMSSFKFFTVAEPIGAIVADRRDGIVGHLGAEAPMVPVTVTVNGHTYSFRTVRHPVLMPLLTGYLSQASQAVRGRNLGLQTVSIRVSVHYPGLETATVSAAFAGVEASAEASAIATALIAYLESSVYEKPEAESIDISLDTVESLESASIVDIIPERRIVRPGENLAVHFRLRPHRGPAMTRTLMVHVPETTPEGRIDLVGADGTAWTTYDLRMRPLKPADFADEVRLVNSIQPSTTLVAVLERRDAGVVVPGGTVSAPPSVVMQMQSALGPNLDTVAYRVVAKTDVEMPYPVSGAQRIPLTVRVETRESETR
ncbi:MAG: hypothetical protein LJE93_04145 [Acidobacteria bacterium]|jgi:hypothetical protein|nr:hypothetical protein [Acidobacteriota bacterium]